VSRFLNSDPVGLSMTDNRSPEARNTTSCHAKATEPQTSSGKPTRAKQGIGMMEQAHAQGVARGVVVWGPALWRLRLSGAVDDDQAGKRLILAAVFRVPAEPLFGRGRVNG
jgi:hypothetical protein